ncbi:MAG: CBS domain-containing protein [Psychrobacter sp.]|nr:CBS domain-containing protein [Psychrobacter sp.]
MADILVTLLPDPQRKLIYVLPDVNLSQCCSLMVEHDIGALIVWDEINVLGVLSERDLIRNCLYKHKNPENVNAAEVMCANISILTPSSTLEEAISVITTTKRRHILIKEGDEVIAILSQGDILLHMLHTSEHKVDQLERYIYS